MLQIDIYILSISVQATAIAGALGRAYRDTLDLAGLCVLPGQTCWILYVDILVLEVGVDCAINNVYMNNICVGGGQPVRRR